MKQVRFYIKGDVIGVGFRAWTKIQAKILGVKGWVKNVHDREGIFGPGGGIEALAQAEEEKMNEFVAKLKQGSPVSRVDDVEVYFEEPREIFETYEIIR